MENIEQFIDLVKRMRKSQDEFFRTRSSIALSEAKKLEKEVDKMLPSDLIPNRASTQPKLF